MRELGTGRYILQNKDNPQYEETLDHNTENRFICRVVTEIQDVPEHLENLPRFKYNNKHFIAAGTFKERNLKTFKQVVNKTEWTSEKIVDEYNYNAFYKASKKTDKKINDIFWCVETGCYVVPTNNGLQKINL